MTAVAKPVAAARVGPTLESQLRWPDALSAVIAVLMIFASLGGLAVHGLYRDNSWSASAFRGNGLLLWRGHPAWPRMPR